MLLVFHVSGQPEKEGEGEKKSGFVGIEGTDIWLYKDTNFQVILKSTNNKLQGVAGYFQSDTVVTWLSCFPWATSRAPAHCSQGSSRGRILGNTFAGDKDGHSCVSGDLHRGDKIQNCWMEKNPNQINTKKSPNKTNSAQEEINPQIKGMCWQSGICWLLSDLVLWINDFFSVLLHLFQPLPSFIIASLLCCSD